jgi:hypothetical protein
MVPDRDHAAHKPGQPAQLRGIDRRARQDGGGHAHQITHGTLEVELAFDVVLTQHPDLAGREMGQDGCVLDAQADRGVGCAELFSVRHL